jgi:hypothetical protein
VPGQLSGRRVRPSPDSIGAFRNAAAREGFADFGACAAHSVRTRRLNRKLDLSWALMVTSLQV